MPTNEPIPVTDESRRAEIRREVLDFLDRGAVYEVAAPDPSPILLGPVRGILRLQRSEADSAGETVFVVSPDVDRDLHDTPAVRIGRSRRRALDAAPAGMMAAGLTGLATAQTGAGAVVCGLAAVGAYLVVSLVVRAALKQSGV